MNIECDDLLIDERMSDYPVCMWSGVEIKNEEQCKRCQAEGRKIDIENSARCWKQLFKEE